MKAIIFIKNWLQAIRIYSLTASIIPVCVGAAQAFAEHRNPDWIFFPLVIICSLFYQAGTNLINDYYDYNNKVDTDYSFGSSMVIQQKLLLPKSLLTVGLAMMIIASGIGFIFVYYRGWTIFLIGLIGFLGGIFYTAGPKGYKYIGLGDIAVFILMGPLMVGGSYFVLTGTFSIKMLLLSLPIGFLVTAILWMNNLRDIKHDCQAGIKTLAMILGWKKSIIVYRILIFLPFLLVLAFCLFGLFYWHLMVIFFSIPLAIKCNTNISKYDYLNPQNILGLVEKTAGLHLVFGTLLIAAVFFGKLLF